MMRVALLALTLLPCIAVAAISITAPSDSKYWCAHTRSTTLCCTPLILPLLYPQGSICEQPNFVDRQLGRPSDCGYLRRN
ncbi:hypothetical protein BC826DRAFT_1049876, partial [Russula brevipes]